MYSFLEAHKYARKDLFYVRFLWSGTPWAHEHHWIVAILDYLHDTLFQHVRLAAEMFGSRNILPWAVLDLRILL